MTPKGAARYEQQDSKESTDQVNLPIFSLAYLRRVQTTYCTPPMMLRPGIATPGIS